MKTCRDCNNYNSCNKLCEYMEMYVNQDYVNLVEIPLSQLALNIETVSDEVDSVWYNNDITLNNLDWIVLMKLCGKQLTKKQKHRLYLKYWLCFSSADIGEMLGIAKSNVDKSIRSAKRKVIKALNK